MLGVLVGGEYELSGVSVPDGVE
jgi:hypothetical protein